MYEGVPLPIQLKPARSIRELPQYPVFEQKKRILTQVVHEKARISHATIYTRDTLANQIESQWNDVVMHDTKGAVTLVTGYDVIAPFFKSDPDIQGFSAELSRCLKVEQDVNASADVRLEQSNLLLNYFSKHLLNKKIQLPPELQGADAVLSKGRNLARIWKTLYHSSKFLSSVSKDDTQGMDRNFRLLKDSTVFARDIIKKAGGSMTEVEGLDRDLKIDGVKGIMLFNFLKNAEKYRRSKVKVAFNGDAITISNDSPTPFNDETLDNPGKPGPNGNTGYGVFVSKNIFGLLGGYDVVLNSGTAKDGNPPYNISFTIKPAVSRISQPGGIVSPLPPPAR